MQRLAPIVALVLLFTPVSAPAQVEPGQSFTGKVTSVIDGDTYEVDRPAGPVVKVRLWGIDAPQFDQPYGVKARDAAAQYIKRPSTTGRKRSRCDGTPAIVVRSQNAI